MASAEDELREELFGSEPEETIEHRGRRVVEPDAGAAPDDEKDLVADLAEGEENLSAEEQAIHVEEAP
jgi:hypothetical protein